MKFVRVILLVFLGLTALVQFGEGLASIADPAGMMAGLGLLLVPALLLKAQPSQG